MELFAADGHDAGGCERVTGKSGMRPSRPPEPMFHFVRNRCSTFPESVFHFLRDRRSSSSEIRITRCRRAVPPATIQVMVQFKSWLDYYNFEWSVRRECRYIRSPENEEFLSAVLATAVARTSSVAQGSTYWRAQLGHSSRDVHQSEETFREECAFPTVRMIPLSDRAPEGRVNPNPDYSWRPRLGHRQAVTEPDSVTDSG